jgi:hypothetical protein
VGDAASIGREIRAALSVTIRDVMLLVLANLKASTPVDTGHAASNWIVTFRTPFQGVDGSRAAVSTAQQDAGEDRLRRYDVGRDGAVVLRNNVPYVKYLDRGSSQQAPAGFVRMAIMAAMRRAPHGRRGAVRQMLRGMARTAIRRSRTSE